MRSPKLVGRDAQLAAVSDRVAGARAGAGGVVVLVGDAGSGKSRLVQEATGGVDRSTVLRGRAVDSPNPVPFRPLIDAFQTAFRGVDRPDDVLGGLTAHVGALVPAWAPAMQPAEAAPAVVVGEAAIRLLRHSAEREPCLLVVEDLHWADPETLEVVELVADATRDVPALTICTTRPAGAADGLIDRLARREPRAVIPIEPLDAPAVRAMVAACLDVDDPPPGLAEFVHRHSEGNPFLVEELLAGLVASADLARVDGHWSVAELRATVPSSLHASIRGRMAALDPAATRVLGAAALLGRDFDWELLPGIAEADGGSVVQALRSGAEVGLIEVRHSSFRFHHALTREAVLAELLPPELQHLAARAWPVIERAHPGLPGPALELAADLAEVAGDPTAAVDLLVRSVRRSLAAGAVATAESTARHAVRIAEEPTSSTNANLALVEVLVTAGKVSEAFEVGRELSARLPDVVEDAVLAHHHLTLARAAVTAGDLEAASAEVAAARALAGDDGADLTARIDVVAAHVALDAGDLAGAAELAELARAAAATTDQLDVVCEAMLLAGRVVRADTWSASIELFEHAAAIAEGAGLASWHLRARQELASSSWITGDTAPLLELRTVASRYGAVSTVTQLDLALADMALTTFDADGCARAASECAAASRRYRLASEPVAHLWLAGAHALAGDDDAMHRSIEDALAHDPDDPRILGDLYGRVLVTRAFVRDELDAIPELLEHMAEHVRRAPIGTSVFPGRVTRAVLHAIDGDDRAAASRAELELLAGTGGMPFFDLALELVAAVTLGREGDAAAALATFAPAYDVLAASPLSAGSLHSLALFLAPAAHRDGWGDPAGWLRAAEAWFDARGQPRTSRRCRLMLGEVGAPVPRRGRGTSPVPEALRAMGVTSREVDVLRLVAAGRTNREIAEELYLSSKTIERHLSNLFHRTGVTSRQQLVALTGGHLGEPDQ